MLLDTGAPLCSPRIHIHSPFTLVCFQKSSLLSFRAFSLTMFLLSLFLTPKGKAEDSPIFINTPEAKDLVHLTMSHWLFSKHPQEESKSLWSSVLLDHFSYLSKFSFSALPSQPLRIVLRGINTFRQYLNLHDHCILSSSSLALPTNLHSPNSTSFLRLRLTLTIRQQVDRYRYEL